MIDLDLERAENAARDRRFKVCGEVFAIRASIRPEAVASYYELTVETPVLEALPLLDATVKAMIEDGDGEAGRRWDELRARDEDALSLADLWRVVAACFEALTARPTTGSNGSSPTPGDPPSGTFSTVVFSPPAEPEPEASTSEAS